MTAAPALAGTHLAIPKCELCRWTPTTGQKKAMDELLEELLRQPRLWKSLDHYIKAAGYCWSVAYPEAGLAIELDVAFWQTVQELVGEQWFVAPWLQAAEHQAEVEKAAAEKAQALSADLALEHDVPAEVIEQMHPLLAARAFVWLDGEGPLPYLRKIEGFFEHRDGDGELLAFGVLPKETE